MLKSKNHTAKCLMPVEQLQCPIFITLELLNSDFNSVFIEVDVHSVFLSVCPFLSVYPGGCVSNEHFIVQPPVGYIRFVGLVSTLLLA